MAIDLNMEPDQEMPQAGQDDDSKTNVHVDVSDRDAYILKRWTWDAEDALGEPDGKDNPGKKEMPLEQWRTSTKKHRGLIPTGCGRFTRSQDGQKIVRTHLKAMKQELDVLARREEKKAREAAKVNITMPSSSAPTENIPPEKPIKTTRRRRGSKPIAIPTTSPSLPHISSNNHIQNPPTSATRGRPQEIANKAPLDLATKKPRKCSFCKSELHTVWKCEEKLKLMGYKP
ncbi:hypothetical protein ACQ4PT_032499 [Festuca glaucescens]